MPLDDAAIDAAVGRYRREIDRYRRLTDIVADACRALVKDHAIRATVQWRVKTVDRLRSNLERDWEHYDSVDDVFERMRDLAGVRVSTYLEKDRGRAVDQIVARFLGPMGGTVVPVSHEGTYPSFQRLTECEVWLPDEDLVGLYENLSEVPCEIQVCSLLSEIWNELGRRLDDTLVHGEASEREVEALANLGHLVRGGEGLVEMLFGATAERLRGSEGEFVDRWDFVARMGMHFPQSRSFSQHAGQLFDELQGLGLTTPEAIMSNLVSNGSFARAEQEGRTLVERLAGVDGAEVTLDLDSSDPLMALFLRKHWAEVIERHPVGRGRGRPPRIARTAAWIGELVAGRDQDQGRDQPAPEEPRGHDHQGAKGTNGHGYEPEEPPAPAPPELPGRYAPRETYGVREHYGVRPATIERR